MKANDGSGDIQERDEWETPQELWDKLNEQYHFDFDCCANKSNTKTKDFSNDFLNIDLIFQTCWMNPPFSKAKEMFSNFFYAVRKGVAIYRCDNMETFIWQDLILEHANWIFIPRGRISYHLATDNANGRSGSRFPSALIGVGVDPPKYVKGICLITKGKLEDIKEG